MGNFIDETGNKYNRLTVIERAPTPPGKDGGWWRCLCDCGNEVVVKGTLLRNNNTKSCGCLQKDFAKSTMKDETGKVYGFLTVIERAENRPNRKTAFWKCLCACGRETIVEGTKLRDGHTKSCGWCYPFENETKIDETGNIYGKLTVLEEAGRTAEGKVKWLCQCECGNLKVVSGCSLRSGLTKSCGCLHSQGEETISKILSSLQINYIPQKTFKDCKNETTDYYLYFDFYLPDFNTIIEYHGVQHYMTKPKGFYTQEALRTMKERDKFKKEYCIKNNIKYIEISYLDFDKINEEYIKEVVLCGLS